MKYVALFAGIALLATSAHAQSAADVVPDFTDTSTLPDLVVTGYAQLPQLRSEWREPEVRVERGLGARQYSYTVPMGSLGNYSAGIHREWTQDHIGDSYGPAGRNDNTFRLACPTPILENCLPNR